MGAGVQTPRSVAIESALEAGRILRDYFGTLDSVDFKGEIDIVTDADRSAERAVLDRLRHAFPEFGVLAEESGASEPAVGSNSRWIIDPLDGTTNFANGYPHFCVSIGLEVDSELRLGVVYQPMLDELFIAERGQGAWLNGERLAVSRTEILLSSVLATGFHYDPAKRGENLPIFAHFTHQTRAVRRDGSATLDLCYVAAGRFDGFWETGIRAWDAAAGTLLISEAGGTMTDYAGNQYRIDTPECVATNGLIHSQVLSGIQHAGEGSGAR